MKFNLIDREKWKRKEYFEHYYSQVPCTYSMTVKIDITKIIKSGRKIYPAMLYYLTKTVNINDEFRVSFNKTGKLGIFDELIPCYTVFNKTTETFSNIWTEYKENYDDFYTEYKKDIEIFGSVNKMEAKSNVPDNVFFVSMIPWETFDGFNLNIQKDYNYLLPIFTMGKYYNIDEKYMLPLAIQVHHSVCDGFHVCRFVQNLKSFIEM